MANGPVPVAAISYQKFIFLTMTHCAKFITVKITVWHFCGTDCVCYHKISLQWRQ